MLKHIKSLLKDSLFFIAILITILIGYLSLMKVPEYTSVIARLDKLEHVLAYFVLTGVWLFTLKDTNSVFKKKSLIIIACVFYGIILEALQMTLTSYRTGDYLDIIANSIGVFLALLIFNRISKKNQVI